MHVSCEILESNLVKEDTWWWVTSQARKDVVGGVNGYK